MRITRLSMQSTFFLLILTGININAMDHNRDRAELLQGSHASAESEGFIKDIAEVDRHRSFLSFTATLTKAIKDPTDTTEFLKKLEQRYNKSHKFYVIGTPTPDNAPYTYRLCAAAEDQSFRRILGGLFTAGTLFGLAYLGAKVLYNFSSYSSHEKLVFVLFPLLLYTTTSMLLKRREKARRTSPAEHQAPTKGPKPFTQFQDELLQQLNANTPVRFMIHKTH